MPHVPTPRFLHDFQTPVATPAASQSSHNASQHQQNLPTSPPGTANAASPSSPTSSYGSSSSSFRPTTFSSSSSVTTSPPCHQVDPSSGPFSPTSQELISSRSQQLDLLKVQRELFHTNAASRHNQQNTADSYTQGLSWHKQLEATLPSKKDRPGTAKASYETTSQQRSLSSDPNGMASVGIASPQRSAAKAAAITGGPSSTSTRTTPTNSSHRQGEDHSAHATDRGRGFKTRRASSGGSRIPERARADNDTIRGPWRDADTKMGDQRLLDASSMPFVPSSVDPQGTSTTPQRPTAQALYEERAPSAASSSSSTARPTAEIEPGPKFASRLATSHSTFPVASTSLSTSSIPAHNRPPLPHLDLVTYPSQDLLKVLAALLHHIATSNDAIRPPSAAQEERDRKRSVAGKDAHQKHAPSPGYNPSGITMAAMGALGTPSSTLCFHARNVPSINIESYLLRILKYCPTTNDVFLSLLVYFDRMSRVASGVEPRSSIGEPAGAAAGLPSDDRRSSFDSLNSNGSACRSPSSLRPTSETAHPGMKGFAVDSYNVHRLLIAGVTAASKFFSDVFYTNSRYAKVGGLPVHELNQLELQFLLLNDFKLVIPLAELQSYADQLLVYATRHGAIATQPVKELGISDDSSRAAGAVQCMEPSGTTRSGKKAPSPRSPEAHAPATTKGSDGSFDAPADRSAAAAVPEHQD